MWLNSNVFIKAELICIHLTSLNFGKEKLRQKTIVSQQYTIDFSEYSVLGKYRQLYSTHFATVFSVAE